MLQIFCAGVTVGIFSKERVTYVDIVSGTCADSSGDGDDDPFVTHLIIER